MSFRAEVLGALRAALGDDAQRVGDLDGLLTTPPKVELGDLAFPCFALAKLRRAAPPQIAATLADTMRPGGALARITATGPYVNFFADPRAQLAALASDLRDGSFLAALQSSTPQRVMIEFSQPNTHKVFHVGHLRNVAVGDALVRVFRARGHDVVAANYYGDFGIDVAKCLWWLGRHPDEPPPPEGRTAWLGAAYAQATRAVEEAEAAGEDAGRAIKSEIRAVLGALERREGEVHELYLRTRQWCLEEFADVYAWLGVSFDHDFFESELEEAGVRVVDEYLARGVLVASQGAVICDLEAQGLPPALLRKSDGASLYLTWDVALARRKFDEFRVQSSLYVVAAEQTLHFQQLFATLERMGYERAKDCRHVSYELVMLPSGKMSSRKGTAIPFHELRTRVTAAIEEKMRAEAREERAGWTAATWRHTADRIAVACLKYGMLHVGNNRRVTFDLDAWTSPEGDTGAYLLYALARMSGIRRKADGEDVPGTADPAPDGFGAPEERDLLNHLLRHADVVARVEATCDPSGLANWIFEGAKAFARFYQNCPVLKATPALRAARLELVGCAHAVLAHGLGLLGIETVDSM